MKKLLIPFLLLVVLTNACKKDETTTPVTKPSENPMAKILEDKTWTEKSNAAINWELGYVFSTSVKGKISQMGCRMPEPGTYTVSIWEQGTKKLLRQKTVEQSSPEKFVLVNVDELTVEKDVKHVISINTVIGGKAKMFYTIANANTNIFPIARGSILIQQSVYKVASTSTFPDGGSETGRMYGYADFTFIPD